MAEGERDAFIENDVIGNYAVGTSFLGNLSTRRARRKNKKRRKKGIFRRVFKKRRKSRTRKRNRIFKSSSKIKYTKNGQPYRILSNGRARFIKGKRRK